MTQADLQNTLNNQAGLARATTLFREVGLRTLLLHLGPGESIPEHKTNGAIMVHCLEGKGSFVAGNDRVELRPGLLLSLPPAAPHAVTAAEHEHILLLVTVSEQIRTEA
jgi:quercetin dioxygenase-like cupin family protein